MRTELAVPEQAPPTATLRSELGPIVRSLGQRYFESVRFPAESEAALRDLHERGFVVHVMRTSAWVNYLYLAWSMAKRGLPPIRAVVNLRRWFTRPWSKAALRGDFEVRLTYARRGQGSALVFLRQSALGSAHGKYGPEDPFPSLVAFAKRSDRTVFLLPELFVWEKRASRLKPSVLDHIFGSPDAPGFLHTVVAFWRNRTRAQFRVGEPIDLKQFVSEQKGSSEAAIARKVRSALHHHLARETRAVFGPPRKPTRRLLEEVMRDRTLRKSLETFAESKKRRFDSVLREAERDLRSIAAKPSPTVVALVSPLLSWVFNRIYDGIEVDDAGLDRALKAAARSPIVLCPSHKSHVDYLLLSWILWNRGYTVPLIAAGANLSFFPLGTLFRRGGAFFLRRSFKGDLVYAAVFKAYVKKLVHDGVHQEFFPEGGRSRTGKLLPPKLGMITWEVDAVLERASKELFFIPVSIDYEKVVESSSYTKELAGGEKRPESVKSLLSAAKVPFKEYGRIHLGFDEPISLTDQMRARGLSPEEEITDEAKRGLVRALGHRIMYGISRASTVTPQALLASALLAHRRRGIFAKEVADRIGLLRRIGEEDGARFSSSLKQAPSDPTVLGPIQDALRGFTADEMLRVEEAKGESIFRLVDERRPEMSFYKNTAMNFFAARALVACAILPASPAPSQRSRAAVSARALFLSRLFKTEFLYKVGVSFEALFEEAVGQLTRLSLIFPDGQDLKPVPDTHSIEQLTFLADLLREYLESYLLAAITAEEIARGASYDRRSFVKAALETGKAEFLSGRIGAAEAISRINIENALSLLIEQKTLIELDRKLRPGTPLEEPYRADRLAAQLRQFLGSG